MSNDSTPRSAAESLVDRADERWGIDLDFSPESLTALDAVAETLSQEERTELMGELHGYLGEVFVRNYNGEWYRHDEAGWVIDFGRVHPDEDVYLFPLTRATKDLLMREVTFGFVHDDAVGPLDVEAPTLTEVYQSERPGTPMGPSGRRGHKEMAQELVDEWSDYELDYTPASLAEVDRLVADHFDESEEGVDRAERVTSSPPGAVPDAAALQVDLDGPTSRIASYVGEVFCRTYDAEWRSGEMLDHVVIEGERWVEFQPAWHVTAAFSGYVSFERLHDEGIVGTFIVRVS